MAKAFIPKRPICCNKVTEFYVVRYLSMGQVYSIETGFKCMVCNRSRIAPNRPKGYFDGYMNGMEAIRLAGIEYDKNLSNKFQVQPRVYEYSN